MSDAIQRDAKQIVDSVQHEFKTTSQKGYAITYGIALFFCLVYSSLFRGKDERLISFSLLLTSIVLTAIAIAIRALKGNNLMNQYAWVVVLLNVFSLISAHSPFYSLVLGSVPVAINMIRTELKQD